MELWQLRTFCSTAEALNFTKAAKALNLTQSAVSHQIKALEEELGVDLFIRGKRGVVLTDPGRSMLEHAKRILAEAELLRQDVTGKENALTGTIRVAAATQALVHLFAPLFEEFMDRYETADLVFRTTTTTEQTVASVLDGSIDVGFASFAVYSPMLSVEPLFNDSLVLVAGSRHRLAKAPKIRPADLDRERWILFERGASIRRATDIFFKETGIDPEKALESNDTYFIKLMIEHDLGISMLPSWTVREEVAAGRLFATRVRGHDLKRSVAMVSLKDMKAATIKTFLRFMTERKEILQRAAAL